MVTGLTFLEINGLTLHAVPGEIENFAVKIAVDTLDMPEVSE